MIAAADAGASYFEVEAQALVAAGAAGTIDEAFSMVAAANPDLYEQSTTPDRGEPTAEERQAAYERLEAAAAAKVSAGLAHEEGLNLVSGKNGTVYRIAFDL